MNIFSKSVYYCDAKLLSIITSVLCRGVRVHVFISDFFRRGSFDSVRVCTEQIIQFFQEIQTIHVVLALFDVARLIAV